MKAAPCLALIAFLLFFAACALPWRGVREMKLPDQAMPAARREVVPWLRCPRFFTKDSGRGELGPSPSGDITDVVAKLVPDSRKTHSGHRQKGDIAAMVRGIAENGGNAFRLSVFWGGEAFFQSRVAPRAPNLGDIDYLREALDEGSRLGVRIVTYMNPNCIYDDHPLYPEAVIRKADGSPWLVTAYGMPHRFYACMNHPKYRKLILDTIAEIFTSYGPAGLYLDGLTPHICFCPYCRERYRAMFGQDMPATFERHGPFCVLWEMASVPQLVGDPADPDSYRLTRFLAQSLHDMTRDVTEAARRAKPDAVVIYHSWPKPSTLRYYNATLDEIYVSRPWHHTLWKDGEIASFSAPFPIPVLQNVYLQHNTDCEARHKMVQALANGVYPNAWSFRGMKPVFEFIRANERYLDFNATEPVRHVALVRELHRSSAQAAIASAAPRKEAFDRFLSPYVGLYSLLLHARAPMATLHRRMVEDQLDGYRVLCLANEAALSESQLDAIERFVRKGGGLIATGETSLYDELGRKREDFGLAPLLGARYRGTLRPPESATVGLSNRARLGEPRVPAFAGAAPSWQLRFTADHEVTRGLGQEHIPVVEEIVRVEPAGAEALAAIHGDGLPAEGVPAVLIHQYGKGRVVYLPNRLDSTFSRWLDAASPRLIANAVEWACQGRVPCRVASAAGRIGVTVYDQSACRIVHLVNHTADPVKPYTEIAPVDEVAIDLEVPKGKRVAGVRALWSGQALDHRVADGRLHARLPRLGEYEVVVAEWE